MIYHHQNKVLRLLGHERMLTIIVQYLVWSNNASIKEKNIQKILEKQRQFYVKLHNRKTNRNQSMCLHNWYVPRYLKERKPRICSPFNRYIEKYFYKLKYGRPFMKISICESYVSHWRICRGWWNNQYLDMISAEVLRDTVQYILTKNFVMDSQHGHRYTEHNFIHKNVRS